MSLTDNQKNILESAGKVNLLKLAVEMPKLFNKLCASCRMTVIRMSKRGSSEAILETIKMQCHKCTPLIEKVEEKFR